MRDSQAKLILFTQLRTRHLSEAEAALFPVRLRNELVSEGVVKRLPDGGLALVNDTGYSATTPSQPPPATPSAAPPALMPTITARVPQEVIDYLDSLGLESRGAAVRSVFAKVLSSRSGTRKAAGS